MKILNLEFAEGARQAKGVAVVIDVFRAFSTACYLYGQGAESVIAASTPEDAFEFAGKNSGILLAGERNEKKIAGFDFGNSPSEVIRHDLTGKKVVLTTSAGTLGLMHAKEAAERITGSFVNAGAVIKYILQQKPETVSLVAMGYNARVPADEDRLCARYIESGLLHKKLNINHVKSVIKSGTGRRFFDPGNLHSPEKDYYLCLDMDSFDFVLKAVPDGKYMYLNQIFI